MSFRFWCTAFLVAAIALITGCGESAGDQQLTVFAAASLTDAFEEIKSDFEQKYPDIDVTMNFAGSQVLATQLGQGARADVFASANETQMDVAIQDRVVSSDTVVFARNQLVIIVPKDNPANIISQEDLASNGVKLVLGDDSVPIGRYSRTVLDNMESSGNFGPDFLKSVESNIVTLESNVLQIVAKIQLGEADAGIVYRTDITDNTAGSVEIVEISVEFNVEAIYPVAAVEGGRQELAMRFIEYLVSSGGQAVLAQYGFKTEPQE